MLPRLELDAQSPTPLYRQLHEQLRSAILGGRMVRGERIPPTRELAQSIGLNRATISAAFDVLEAEGLIRREIGRGSFVEGAPEESGRLDWAALAPDAALHTGDQPAPAAAISFSASRPSEIM